MKLELIGALVGVLCVEACAQAPLSPVSGSPVPAGQTGADGTYVAQFIGGSCGSGAPQIVVKGGVASFTSSISGAHTEAPVNPDGSYNLVTPPTGQYGVTTIHVNADGTGTFEVKNQFRPCSSGLALRRN